MNDNSEMNKKVCSNNLLHKRRLQSKYYSAYDTLQNKEVYAGHIKCSSETLQNLEYKKPHNIISC